MPASPAWHAQPAWAHTHHTHPPICTNDSQIYKPACRPPARPPARQVLAGAVPLNKYVITKQLTKRPEDYPDAKSQPHVQVSAMQCSVQTYALHEPH